MDEDQQLIQYNKLHPCIASNNYQKQIGNADSEDSSMIDDMKENMSNFMKLEINRRLAQGTSFL